MVSRMTNRDLIINGLNLIRLPLQNEDATFLIGFWQWVELLSRGDYQRAIEALFWTDAPWTPDQLETRITTFFSKTERFIPVIPNQRLIGVINEHAEVHWREDG